MPTVRSEQVEDGITVVTLDRPDRLNAMTHELVADLRTALDDLSRDRECRVVVLTGAGRGFCAGLDLFGAGEPPDVGDVGAVPARMTGQQHIAELVHRLRGLRQPVIAAVNGPAAGGGLALALASDIRLAAPDATFTVAFVRIGLSGCDIGVSWLLPRLVGASTAFELSLTGRRMGVQEAERRGLVTRVVPADELVPAALDIARQIRSNSPFGVWMTKEVLWSNLEVASLRAAIDLENRTQILTTCTNDQPEAMAAWREKREPDFEYG